MKTDLKSIPKPLAAFEHLCELISDIHVAMLTTIGPDGSLRSRPMATQHIAVTAGELWFYTAGDAPKVDEIYHENQVGLAYSHPTKQKYVSVSGHASVVRDPAKLRDYWTTAAKIWFPGGVDDPRLALIRVDVENAEYWDAPSSTMVQLYGLAKSALTGEPPKNMGQHAKFSLI